MNPFLERNAGGEVSIHWRRFSAFAVVTVVSCLIGAAAVWYFADVRFRLGRLVAMAIFIIAPQLMLALFAKRHAEGKSIWQFNLSALLLGITAACVMFALMGADRRADLERFVKRVELRDAIQQIVGLGKGQVHITGGSLIQVKRPTFNDEDLRQILALRDQLEAYDSPISILDLSGTSVTDDGVAELKRVQSLQFCFLDNTTVTDNSVDSLAELPNLKVLSFSSTQVTPQRLQRLKRERPKLSIEPQAYLKQLPQ
jgi:hypothetical protein